MSIENTVFMEGSVWAAERDGKFLGHYRLKSQATKATEHSGHEITIRKFNAGGSPIAGSNWPIWGYKITCTCGYRSGNVSGRTKLHVQSHLMEDKKMKGEAK